MSAKTKKKPDLVEMKEFAYALAAMKHRAGELGLLKTMHAMDKATQTVGWEVAEKIEVDHEA